MIRILAFIGITILLSIQCALSQELHFRHYDFKEQHPGLSYNTIFEDQHHMIWIGTSKGLFSFDGFRFARFELPVEAGTQDVTALFQDPEGIFWVGLANGWIGHLRNDTIQAWDIAEGHPKVRIVEFVQTYNGILWIATYGEGLYLYQENILYNVNEADGLHSNDIYAMSQYRQEVLLGTDAGIHIVGFQDRKKKIRHIGKEDGLPDEIVKAISSNHDSSWFGSFDSGIYLLEGDTVRVFESMKDWKFGEIQTIASYGQEEIWIGTTSAGLLSYHTKTRELRKVYLPEAEHSQIDDLLVDEEGNLWALNRHNGIFLANRHFEIINPNIEDLQAIYKDDHYGMILGNTEGVYHIPDGNGWEEIIPIIEDINVLSLWVDPLGRLWIGTFGQGLYCYDPLAEIKTSYHKKDGLTDESILSIAGKGQKMWLATLGGVTEINLPMNLLSDALETRNYNLDDGLGTNFIYSCFVDSKDRVWFGTDGNGLSMLDNESIYNFTKADSIELSSIYSITEGADGRIWFSTDQNGVFSFDGKNFEHYGFNEGLRHLEINSIIGDPFGKILVTHDGGIDLIVPDHKAILYYSDEVGLSEYFPNLNAAFKDKDGNIWIGCESGIIKYIPYGKFRYTPRTTLMDVNVYLDKVPWRVNNTYKYSQNYLTFSYAGLWYTDPKTVNYRYLLEGLDGNWKSTREQKVTYHRLPPGSYVFRLQSGFGDAFIGESELRYPFTVKKPWYQTNLFRIATFLFLILLIYFVMKLREHRLEKAEQIKRQQVEHELLTLQSQINPHFLFNSFNTLASIIEEDPSRAVEYVENLSDFFRNILHYRSKKLIPLSEELNIASNFVYLLQKRFSENLQFNINVENLEGQIPPLTLQMLIENAVKHNIISLRKPLTINIRRLNGDYIQVENNLQVKALAESSTHYGLQSIINRYSYFSEKPVEIDDNNSKFIVKIPIINTKNQ